MQINKFIEPIVMKTKKHRFKSWRLKRKVVKYCKTHSPTFNEMVSIGEFLTLLREIYMYCNDKENFHLFLSTYPKGYTKMDCCSYIYQGNGFSIGFVLDLTRREVNIEITRTGQNTRGDKEQINFAADSYVIKDKYDEEKMQFIISCLMDGVVELIEWYYKNKRF